MNFLWFWAFWHWSKESFREGTLLHGPLEGLGSHWDEWFHHEASREERAAIETAGLSEATRKAFILWLVRRWCREATPNANRQTARFILNQLALRPPFVDWPECRKYGATYGSPGVQAIVLAGDSRGESADVRKVEALLLPMENGNTPSLVVCDGFRADIPDLLAPWEAAVNLLSGNATWIFLARWVALGKRPYPSWMRYGLSLSWIIIAGIIAYLRFGPDPGVYLWNWCAGLLLFWIGLLAISGFVVGREIFFFWSQGRKWATLLRNGQIRIRLSGDMMLKGGSAGLAYCLNILLAVYRAFPAIGHESWVWRIFFHRLASEATASAATGAVTSDARIKPVTLRPKLRAAILHGKITSLFTPRQSDSGKHAVESLAEETTGLRSVRNAAASSTPTGILRLGFATDHSTMRVHRCNHVTQTMMRAGGFVSGWQAVVNSLAFIVSVIVLIAIPDLKSILVPPPPPAAVVPASPSPYYLWVSLDTMSPSDFQVVLESHFWTNRRVNVIERKGPLGSNRAEVSLQRVGMSASNNVEDGTVWIERRRKLLFREYDPGERVGRYSFSYLAHLSHD